MFRRKEVNNRYDDLYNELKTLKTTKSNLKVKIESLTAFEFCTACDPGKPDDLYDYKLREEENPQVFIHKRKPDRDFLIGFIASDKINGSATITLYSTYKTGSWKEVEYSDPGTRPGPV